MTEMQPKLSPLQALEACRKQDHCTIDEWKYWLDGPQNCPAEMLAPWASKDDEIFFYVSVDIDEPITAESVWASEDL